MSKSTTNRFVDGTLSILEAASEGSMTLHEAAKALKVPRERLSRILSGKNVVYLAAIERFVEECCVSKPTNRVQCKLLYDTYLNWCVARGIASITHKAFTKLLKAQDIRAYGPSTDGRHFYLGVVISQSAIEFVPKTIVVTDHALQTKYAREIVSINNALAKVQ